MSQPIPVQKTAADVEVQEKYVARLRARLARPQITVEDARDGILDCFVSTYHTGVKHGLEGILGVDASPDQVAQVTGRMFRDRLKTRNVSFDNPTVAALNEVKEELDEEFHFSELPAELSATHDQVCSLLLAKADGLIEHHGDESVVSTRDRSAAPTMQGLRQPPSVVQPERRGTQPAVTVPRPPSVSSPVTDNLRQALELYLEETRSLVRKAEPAELVARLDRARSLAQSVVDFSEG